MLYFAAFAANSFTALAIVLAITRSPNILLKVEYVVSTDRLRP